MKVSELKQILEVPFKIKKGFAPITEYIYINKNKIKATDLESYVEVQLDSDFPVTCCLLSTNFKKFLNLLNEDMDLKFKIKDNVCNILYNKKNKFIVPIENLDNFPEVPINKFVEDNLLTTLDLTPDFINNLKLASEFIGIDFNFNGIYLKNNKIYSSNRQIIYACNFEQNIDIFIPINFIKFILQSSNVFTKLEIYKEGFKAVGNNVILYYPSYNSDNSDNKPPDFEKVLEGYKSVLTLTSTDELKEIINRISNFKESLTVSIKDKCLTISSNIIIETIENDNYVGDIEFKFNTLYLKKILNLCDSVDLMINKDSNENIIKLVQGNTDKYKIAAAIMV